MSPVCVPKAFMAHQMRDVTLQRLLPLHRHSPCRVAGFEEVKHAHDITKPYLNSDNNLLESNIDR